MVFDGHVHQLPDIDPIETQEWLDSLDAVVDAHGKSRARYLLSRLMGPSIVRGGLRRALLGLVRAGRPTLPPPGESLGVLPMAMCW